jgi:DNA segregation ATPase FtsK/SpoIIIE, S-DNA-T family
MLKWLKSNDKQAASPVEQPIRPPWIQKIVVPDGNTSSTKRTEVEWQSRLAQKLRDLKPEAPAEPAEVAGATFDENFAFHLVPLTAESPYLTRDVHTHKPPQDAPKPAPVYNPPTEDLHYAMHEVVAERAAAGSYELTHSTLDYGGGDEFDLENLFDEAGGKYSQPWSPPREAIENLIGDLDSESELIAAPEPIRTAKAEERTDSAEARRVDEPTMPNAAPVVASREEKPARQVEKPAAEKSTTQTSGERASVTPILDVVRQRQIPFPLLKTHKRALEFVNQTEAQHVIVKLEETLAQFSIEGRVVGVQRGPIITRYEVKMAAGIKVNRILALSDELAMALEAMRVRIEAPIPGRSTVGIEIPNKQRVKVLLGDILNDVGYREFGGELPLPLGRDIAGNLLLEDLTRMPHLLIAGATGSGKSVAVNSFISSLILNKTPEEVRFLLVDPKLVELSAYNDIPHLLHPVITEPQKAILALNWAVEEMERRYEDLADMRSRDIRSFNEKVRSQKGDAEYPPMPYIVVLIDELGDLMMVAGKDVESSIIRLAQKARAVGIHLILATQRPSVDVITALIKANCPARIALQVAQKTDSRTILDGNGAEQLLGQGDMLFRHPSKAQLIRAQVPLIEDNEVEDVVNYAKKLAKPVYITLEDPKGKMGELEAGDEDLFEEAWQIITESQKASASYLQRRLRIGYNKAARLIEAFEARGMIGPQVGSKPREIIGGTGQGRDVVTR